MSRGLIFHSNHSAYKSAEKRLYSYSVDQSLIAFGKLHQNIKNVQNFDPVTLLPEIYFKETIKYV